MSTTRFTIHGIDVVEMTQSVLFSPGHICDWWGCGIYDLLFVFFSLFFLSCVLLALQILHDDGGTICAKNLFFFLYHVLTMTGHQDSVSGNRK